MLVKRKVNLVRLVAEDVLAGNGVTVKKKMSGVVLSIRPAFSVNQTHYRVGNRANPVGGNLAVEHEVPVLVVNLRADVVV